MNSHNLAKLLLSLPDLPVATYSHGHTYSSRGQEKSHGPLMIGLSSLGYIRTDGDPAEHIVIGDMLNHTRFSDMEIVFDGREKEKEQ